MQTHVYHSSNQTSHRHQFSGQSNQSAFIIMVRVLSLLILISLCGCGNKVHHAAWDGDFATVKNWIEEGGYVNARHSRSGGNILAYAAGSGNVDLVKYLIAKGATVNDCDNNGTTPLHYAARENHDSIIRVLVQAGANPNVFADKYKRSYTESHTALMEFPYEGTPLHWALCSKGKPTAQKEASIKALLEAGADPNATSTQVDHPPLELAVVHGNSAIVRMLIQANADTRTGVALHQAVSMDNYEMVKLLIECGSDVNKPARSLRGFQPLDEIAGQPVPLGGHAVTPLSLAKSDQIRQLLVKSGARD